MNINSDTIERFEVNEREEIIVSFTIEERERNLPPFAFATIERVEDEDIVTETLSIQDAEQLYNALGEAIEVAKRAVNEYLAELKAA